MAKGIKNKQEKRKILSKDVTDKKRGSGCEQYPSFSFRYLTTNNKYNFDYFKTQSDRDNMKKYLLDRMKEITERPYTHWNGLPKVSGSETIPYWKCKIKPNGLEVSQDDKIIVFRFFQQNYRLIGIRLESCPIFFVIGFDFDYSAYNHGS